jgi:hypothetical protein
MLDFMKRQVLICPTTYFLERKFSNDQFYNQLVLNRNRILKSATEVNPSVVKMDQKLPVKSNVQGV